MSLGQRDRKRRINCYGGFHYVCLLMPEPDLRRVGRQCKLNAAKELKQNETKMNVNKTKLKMGFRCRYQRTVNRSLLGDWGRTAVDIELSAQSLTLENKARYTKSLVSTTRCIASDGVKL